MNFTNTDCVEKWARKDYWYVRELTYYIDKGKVVSQVKWQVDEQINRIQTKISQEINK